jgi:hypothetical protein
MRDFNRFADWEHETREFSRKSIEGDLLTVGFKCDHKCHDKDCGLNPWIEECPSCCCANPKYDPKVPAPETWDELINWNHPDPAQRPEKYRGLKV